MSEIRTAPIVSAPLSKGFLRPAGRDHEYFIFYRHGKKTGVFTKISHGQRTVDDWLIGKMSHQMHLSKREFLSFVECTLSGPGYERLLVDRVEEL